VQTHWQSSKNQTAKAPDNPQGKVITRRDYDLAERPSVKKKPMTAETIPPMSNHIDSSVGLPVKNRETSELNDSDALMPKIISRVPTISNPIPSDLFIIQPFILMSVSLSYFSSSPNPF
jgi:hypothetical protein